MTESIKLRENDFDLESKINDEEFNETYQKYCIYIIDNDNKTANQLKQQILENQEKLEKIEKLYNYYKFQVWESPDNHRMVCKRLREILKEK